MTNNDFFEECIEDDNDFYNYEDILYEVNDDSEMRIALLELFTKTCLLLIMLIVCRTVTDRSFLDDTFESSTIPISEEIVPENMVSENNITYVTKTEEPVTEIYQNYLEAKSVNNNTVGWIKINGTLINYPIMHSSANDFYLNHNFNDVEDANGAIYLESAQEDWDFINIIHGHNLKSGKMFGQLMKYKEEEFLKEHLYIEIAREKRVEKYKIFSVFIADGSNEEFALQFTDYVDYKLYYSQLLERSKFEIATSVDSSNILILNTCSYEFSNAHFIVCAQLVEG